MFGRPGFRTSEFAVSLLVLIGSIVAAALDYISNSDATQLSIAGAIGFILSRGLAKYETRPGPGPTPPVG